MQVGLYRAAASADSQYVAAIKDDFSFQIFRINNSLYEIICDQVLPKTIHDVLLNAVLFKWSPSIASPQNEGLRGAQGPNIPRLLVSDGIKLTVLNPNALLAPSYTDSNHASAATCIVADFQLGEQFGKLTHADFILGDEHVITFFEMAGHASVLSVAGPQREDIPNVKFNDHRSIAVSPNRKIQAVLLRSKGQDHVAVLVKDDGGVKIQSSFSTHTSDAQGLIWSPDNDPVIAIWDSAAYGVKVAFFSALGHSLKQLDITALPEPDIDIGVGVTALTWAKSANGTMIALADGHKQVMLREQHHRTMVSKPDDATLEIAYQICSQ